MNCAKQCDAVFAAVQGPGGAPRGNAKRPGREGTASYSPSWAPFFEQDGRPYRVRHISAE